MKLPALHSRRGMAAIQAAILFPLLVLVLLAGVEYGWCFMKYRCIQSAAREGVRAASRQGATDSQWQAAVASTMAKCGKGGNAPTYTRKLSPGVNSTPGTELCCTVVVAYSQLKITNAPSLFPVPVNLTAKATMAKEGTITHGP